MKHVFKYLCSLLLLIGLFIIPMNSNAAAPIYLNGDPNFVRIDSHYGDAYYLDKSSLYVRKYAPPDYEIVANVCGVKNAAQGNVDIAKVITTEFRYDISKKKWKMYYSYPSLNSWRYIEPKYTYANNGIVLPAGEMCFYLAYQMKFYGKQHVGLFPDSFYSRV